MNDPMTAFGAKDRRLVDDPTQGNDRVPGLRLDRLTPEQRVRAEQLWRERFDGIGAVLAGGANVTMQLSWPEVAYGVMESRWDRGAVTKHPIKRARTTLTFIAVAVWGTDEQVRDFREAVNTAHRVVRSGPDSPVRYNAFNRDLQLWVASCLYYGARDVMTRTYGPLDDADEEVLLQASARFGTCLQVPLDMWHTDREAFEAYWERGLERARMDDRMRDYLNGVMGFTFLGSPVKQTVGRLAAWVNTGFLPPALREEMGRTWSARDQARHDRLIRVVGLVYRRSPGFLRRLPFNVYLRDLDVRRRFRLVMV